MSGLSTREAVTAGIQVPVMEHFYTIQGEGAHTGDPAYFIRLAGCDVGCVWCDVKESWETEGYPVLTIERCLEYVQQSPAPNVVITGGEPAIYNLNPLTHLLKEAGLRVWLETSGAYPITGSWDWICLSPKKFKPCLEENYERADELKMVVANRNDFNWAESHARKVTDACRLYLQPEWSRAEKLYPRIVAYVQEQPRWSVSVQTHKYMQIP